MEPIFQQRLELMEASFVTSDDGNLFLQLAETYRAAGDVDGALRILRKGLESHPGFTPAFAVLGDVLFDAGRASEAAVCFEQLLELDPSNEAAREKLSSLQESQRVRAAATSPGNGNGNGAHAPAAQQTDVPTDAPADEVMPWESDATVSAPPQDDPVPGSFRDPVREPAQRETVAAPPVAHLEATLSAGGVESTVVALADLLVGLLEYRDPFFRGGTSLTRLLTAAIARDQGADDETVSDITLGAVLRDLGQLPLKGLIDKPGSELGDDSRRKLERHVDTALELLEGVKLAAATRDTIRHHHERWDGAGYPDGIAGDAIPLGARIVAVADSFAAMIAARPHRLPKSVPAALDAVRSGAGTQYDPAVVDALVHVLSTTDWRGLRFSLRHHVLVVDPDETRAMVIATKLCSNGYLAEAAFNIDSARERLERTRIAGLIVSSEMPQGEDRLLLREVRETERLGMVPVIITDAGVTDRVALLQAGADVCLGRGASFEELKATMEAFLRRQGNTLPATNGRPESWAGLQGDIQDFPLGWLLQVLNYDSRTAAVFLTGNDDDGAIYLERGNPRHAQTKALTGEDAFRAMLQWPTGTFSVDPDATTQEQSIRSSLMNLLLQQAVQDDHAAFFGAVKV